MALVCIGLSHHTAPVEVRERHAFPVSRMAEALVALRDYPAVREAAMLQTCGRLEIYAEVTHYEEGAAQIKSFLTNFGHGTTGYDIESYLYTRLGRQAIEHLFRVCTGLDSMLIGEAEILGQVKDAYVAAQHAGSLGTTLHRLFREALAAGKAARAQTQIGGESMSIATAAIDAARTRLGTLQGATIAIVGAGKMGRTAARRLREEGAAKVIIVNRTPERAQQLADEVGIAEAVEMREIVDAVVLADVVIASTGASHFVLNRERMTVAMAQRPDRPLFIVDIAVPRDADPAVVEISNVSLLDIDDLKPVIDEKLETRREAIPAVEEIIGTYAGRFETWYHARETLPVVATLMQKAERIRAAELERVLARCPELSERERALVTGMTMTIVSKLLHSVVLKIRTKATLDLAEALSDARVLDELFELDLAKQLAELVPPAVHGGE